MGRKAGTKPGWDSISEREWGYFVRNRFPLKRLRIVRVRPATREYESVVALRYRGFVESGFLRPGKDPVSSMRLPRDRSSIIIGLFRGQRILATMTLNTITRRFPGMAMELEKKVFINHAHFRDPRVLEITKLVVDPDVRGRRIVLALLAVTGVIARILDKHHLWQVSRDVASDISWRAGLGFDCSLDYRFNDPNLNDMPSRVGYMHLPSAVSDPRIPRFVRSIYADALAGETAEAVS
jgi:hypothetical protein